MKEQNDKSWTGKVVHRQPLHILTMINFNWECYSCGYENTASLSEEEDLLISPILTCTNCRHNNKILLSDIYNGKDNH